MSDRPEADDDRRTIDYFTARVAEHGVAVQALDWGSRASQAKRFEMLAAIGIASGDSVLDVGCGQGDLLAWLRESGMDVDYRGVDLTPAMVDTARARFPGASFEVGSARDAGAPGSVDWVFASGIFYLRTRQPFDYLREVVAGLYAACRRGVAFNCLSAWSTAAEPGEYREDPLAVLAACRELTPAVALRHDYHPGDFTVHLRRVGADRWW